MRNRLAILLAAVLSPAIGPWAAAEGPPPEPPAKAKDDPYPEDFKKRVTVAVDHGVEYLLSRQRPDGTWEATKDLSAQRLGVTALATLALLKGGVRPSEPAIEKAFGAMRTMPLDRTYSVGCLLMALHAKYSASVAFTKGEADRYGAEQGVEDPCQKAMSPTDRAWMQKAVEFLLHHREEGHWGYPVSKGPLARFDLSNTQYALLGLWAASRCGSRIPPEVWIEILEWALAYQERTGPSVKLLCNEQQGEYRVAWSEDARARGFRYRQVAEEPLTGSMTTAGLACLVIPQDELWASRKFTPELRARTRKGIRDAMAWLQENFRVDQNPGYAGGGWHHYYLYGLERAGVLARARFVGKHDWYLEGAKHLIEAQGGNGSWSKEISTDVDTAFGVLFLRRATMRTRNAAITPSEPVPGR